MYLAVGVKRFNINIVLILFISLLFMYALAREFFFWVQPDHQCTRIKGAHMDIAVYSWWMCLILVRQSEGAGLVAAAMISIVPGYISRSVAGSYDNEGIAIFCMLLTYYLWIKAVKTGTIYWSALCAIAYFYMVVIQTFYVLRSCSNN